MTEQNPVKTILSEADDLINGERLKTYGTPAESFGRIAELWSGYLGMSLTPLDVTNLMVLLKVSRTKGTYHRDSYVDIAGYAALAEKLDSTTAAPTPQRPSGGTYLINSHDIKPSAVVQTLTNKTIDDVQSKLGTVNIPTWRDESGALRTPFGTVYEDLQGRNHRSYVDDDAMRAAANNPPSC